MEIFLMLITVGVAAAFYVHRRAGRTASLTIDNVIDRGKLYQSLNRHMEFLEVDTKSSLGFRMAKFLSFGAEIARQEAGLGQSADKLSPGPESAGMMMFVQQGIHTLLTLQMGSDALKTPEYRSEWVRIFGTTMAEIFRFNNQDQEDERGRKILEIGRHVTKIAQAENAELLQRIFDAWDAGLSDLSDQSVAQMGNGLREAVEWSRQRL